MTPAAEARGDVVRHRHAAGERLVVGVGRDDGGIGVADADPDQIDDAADHGAPRGPRRGHRPWWWEEDSS